MRFTGTSSLGMVVAGLLLVGAVSAEEALPETTTGSRTWSMADGGKRKLRFVEFSKQPEIATFQWGAAPGGIPLASFSAESRAFLDAIRDGRIKLLTTPGLSAEADFPAGPLMEPRVRDYRVGVVRDWSHRNGRKVRASLINLNDEVVSLLIGEKVWNLPLGDLSDADHRYLEDVKAGRARTAPSWVSLGRYSWEGGSGRDVTVNGHEVIGEPANDHRFEDAMATALEMVRSKLDAKYWEFHGLSEQVTPVGKMAGWSLLAPADPAELGREIMHYQATFRLTPEGRTKAAVIWPHSVTPRAWKGDPELVIDLAPNGEAATVHPPTP